MKIETGSQVSIHWAQESCNTRLFFCNFKHFKHVQTSSDHLVHYDLMMLFGRSLGVENFPPYFVDLPPGSIFDPPRSPWLSRVHLTLGRPPKNQSPGDSKWCKELGVWWQFRVQRLKSWTSAKFYPENLTALYGGYALVGKIPVWCEDFGTKFFWKCILIFSNEDLLILYKHITLH